MNKINAIIFLIFVSWFLYSFYQIRKLWSKDIKEINLHLYEIIPSGFTIIGLLGTFIGIFWGLIDFDVKNINSSIPTLLEGLKTSFLTSIVGIILSFLSSIFIKWGLKELESRLSEEPTDELSALREIVVTINDLKDQIKFNFNELKRLLVSDNDDSISTQIVKLRDQMIEIEKTNNKLNLTISYIRQSIGGDEDTSLLTQLQKLRVDLNEYFKDSRENQNQSIKKFEEIKEMVNSNKELISKKFEEFSDILAKNSTEALVKIMEKTTDEFSKHMSALVNKLVQENFQELNNSVRQMNEWQKENKEMIQSLTNQFIKVSNEFEIAAQSIKEIISYTEQLTNQNGILAKLINELHYVMIEDTKFKEIVRKLGDTIEMIKKNTEAFDETTNKLNNWVKNQMNFTEGVAVLIKKLEEVEKIKDYNEVFWSNTRKQLNEGVAIIEKASKMIAEDLENINAEFYERLNNTLQNLDLLIQRIISNYKK
ncbi:MAG: membrane protein [Bacteroidia bacterium]|nr:MAG: membrane protein [Bacteroidia bacterium]